VPGSVAGGLPSGEDRLRLMDEGTRAWRRRRNAVLNHNLGLAHEGGHEPDYLRGRTGTSVLVALSEVDRRLLAGEEPVGMAQQQPQLDELWAWTCEFVLSGFPNPDAEQRTNRRFPEPRWKALVEWESSTTPHFDRSGIRVNSDRPVPLMTRAGHKPQAYDIGTSRPTPIEVEAPEVLRLDSVVLGDDPGAPAGWYRRAQWRAPAEGIRQVSPVQQGWNYLAAGFFNYRPPVFVQLWNDRLHSLQAQATPPLSPADRALLASIAGRPDAFRGCVALLANPPSTGPVRRLLGLRSPDAGRFLAFLFFEDVTATRSARNRDEAERQRGALGGLFFTWLYGGPHVDAASALFPGGDRSGWPAVVTHLLTSTRRSTSARSRSGDWFRAAGAQTLGSPPLRLTADASARHALEAELRRVITAEVSLFLRDPPAAFLGEFSQYLDNVLPDPPPPRLPSARRPQAPDGRRRRRPTRRPAAPQQTVEAPERDDGRVEPSDMSGSMVTVDHRFVRCAPLAGQPPGGPVATELWVRVAYIHLQNVAAPGESGFPRDRDMCEQRLLGHSGMTGNAATPHIHFEVAIHRTRPDGGIHAAAFLHPMEFLLPEDPVDAPDECLNAENDPCRSVGAPGGSR
jgi:hypothetical protein